MHFSFLFVKRKSDTYFGDFGDYRLSTILFLNRHKLLRHDEPMVCEECGMEFRKCKIYLAHKQNKHPAWTCEECREKKKTKASLTNHTEANHKERIPCDQCGKMYGTKDCLKIHLKQEHGDHEDFQCTECEYKTRYSGSMLNGDTPSGFKQLASSVEKFSRD